MWHPTHYADTDGKDSKYADHLAVASNEKDVHVSEIKLIIILGMVARWLKPDF